MGQNRSLRIVGTWLLVLGFAALIIAAILPTSIVTSDNAYLAGLGRSSSVINIGLLQRQALIFHAGLTSILAGVIFIATDAIVEGRSVSGERLVRRDDGAAPVTLDAEPSTPINPAEADRTFMWIMAGIAAVVFIAFVVMLSGSDARAPEVTAIENNAEAMADQMEAMADNLEAMADRAEAERP